MELLRGLLLFYCNICGVSLDDVFEILFGVMCGIVLGVPVAKCVWGWVWVSGTNWVWGGGVVIVKKEASSEELAFLLL